jgi:prepilin-type processing-associated H-X9-DG protein
MHSGGANFALCDGSVRFLSYDIGPEILPALATAKAGETVAVPQ